MPTNDMDIVLRGFRLKWQIAILIFLITTLGSLGLISLIPRLLASSDGSPVSRELHDEIRLYQPEPKEQLAASSSSVSTIASSTPAVDTPPLNAAAEQARRLREDKTRGLLLAKFKIDTHRRSKLEEERSRLSDPPRSNKVDSPPRSKSDPTAITEYELREQLATALVRLLTLEKQGDDHNPDEIAVRKRISQLQAQIARANQNPPALVRKSAEHRPDLDAQRSRLNSQIVLCDNQISDDFQLLTQLTKPTAADQTGKTEESALTTSPVQPLDDGSSGKIAPWRSSQILQKLLKGARTLQPPSSRALALSLLSGLLFSIVAMFFLGRIDLLIRDEGTLRNILPDSVEYVGSIPRMKKS